MAEVVRRFFQSGLGVESRATTDSEPSKDVIRGVAAVFFDGSPASEYWLWNDTRERIAPGAFDRAIREDDVRALFNHDPNVVLGRLSAGTLRLSVTAKGLEYEIDPPASAAATVESIARGDVSGSSFGGFVRRASWVEDTIDGETIYTRTIEEFELLDVSPVTYPAYSGTDAGVVAGARSVGLSDFAANASARSAEMIAIRREWEQWREALRGCAAVAQRAAALRKARLAV